MMRLRLSFARIVAAGAAALALVAPLSAAHADDDFVSFLWGGGSDFGGGRQVVGFSSQYKPGQIIVSFSDRRLYYINSPGQAISYPVAVPANEARWQGSTIVSEKRRNPVWTPTAEMRAKNPHLPAFVPGGHPMNPLGKLAMYLGSSAYRIHGTDAPWTIGQAVSHGCIRMYNQDVADLFPRIPVGTHVTVTWQHFATGESAYQSPAPAHRSVHPSRRTTTTGEYN